MKDKFKDTKGLDKAYMSLAKHYDESKENAIRQIKEGVFVDLLNQEMEELQNSMKDKEYLILYDGDQVFKIKTYNEISAMVELFDFCGSKTAFNLNELRTIGEMFGLEKLITMFENCEKTKLDIYKITPIHLADGE